MTPAAGAARPATTANAERPLTGATDAVSTASHGVLEAVRGETRRIDGARIAELSDRIERGDYKIDASQLADRIIDDALGPEAG